MRSNLGHSRLQERKSWPSESKIEQVFVLNTSVLQELLHLGRDDDFYSRNDSSIRYGQRVILPCVLLYDVQPYDVKPYDVLHDGALASY